ncbi:flavodoxin domain-containing protein [Streptomyces sp. WMMB 322]|uniref:flavodoxin domain-containing protein n=1 Tax=Streptomyces sp. WMMB 322 TaxID=1286821 RepID=UPI0006E16F18|nr:flavodoxin domain-containing protein [Streptomyces sp. WMMB 322]SCK16087.1 menaquinone-dependent protoporphyrinogen oxidase [Streptomyces sp. WMMB 322]
MTLLRVLVAYSSRNRSTAGIAAWIGETLRDKGLEADVTAAEKAHDISRYDAVVLGSAVYAGRWRSDATRFARLHRHQLRRMPLWLFSSGRRNTSRRRERIPPPPSVARIARRLGAEEHRTFGGRLTDGAGGALAGRLLGEGPGGDLRDQQEVSAWGGGIAARLRSERAGV